MQYHDLTREHHAVDVYYQTPRMMYGPIWIWYIMMDCNEPKEYWHDAAISNTQRGMNDVSMHLKIIRMLHKKNEYQCGPRY